MRSHNGKQPMRSALVNQPRRITQRRKDAKEASRLPPPPPSLSRWSDDSALLSSKSGLHRGKPGGGRGTFPSQRNVVGLRCSGSALVEMLVVITVAAVIMGLGVTTIHRLLGAEHEALKSARASAALARLSKQWREDLHAAVKVDLPAAESGRLLIAVTAEGREIRYELDRHVARRVEELGEGQTHRDSFYFSPRTTMDFARAGALFQLKIEIPASSPAGKNKTAAEAPARQLVIEAAPARDHRFARRGT